MVASEQRFPSWLRERGVTPQPVHAQTQGGRPGDLRRVFAEELFTTVSASVS